MSGVATIKDLSVNHGRHITKDYVQNVSKAVANIAQIKEETWHYVLPNLEAPPVTATISMDGAMLPTRSGEWRESVVGTIALHDQKGNRQHTIYIGEAPEYGKARFINRFSKEIEKIKVQFPHIQYIGIADGAKGNWKFLESRTEKQILDFYHATEYLTKASYAGYPKKIDKQARSKWLEDRCHQLKHKKNAATHILKELEGFRKKHKLGIEVKGNINAAVTYFKNHLHLMNYSDHVKDNLPIGSGITEAACKTLIKQRFCNSGMRWKIPGIKTVLRLRELEQTTGRWQDFWNKIDQYGIPNAA